MKRNQKRNFNAANTARKHLIDDETNKLLILARDYENQDGYTWETTRLRLSCCEKLQ